MWKIKDVYYVSDGTGILATTLGQALICQFPEVSFHEEKFPFVNTVEEAKKTINYIIQQSGGRYPIIFSTLISPALRDIFNHPQVEYFDVCGSSLDRLEKIIEAKALRVPGASRKIDMVGMAKRVEAINYSMEHDDGTKTYEYDDADVILVGVSRSGKTPVSVYLATHMGLKSANYPLTTRDLDGYSLPEGIRKNHKRAIGLTTKAELLQSVRQKRYPDSNYAKRSTCIQELQQAEEIFQKFKLPVIDTSGKSIEELATQITQELGIAKKTSLLKNSSA